MAKEKNYKKDNSRGITLVALVVTIVVLLILAGITITALFSENGIIKKAQEAKNATEQDQANTEGGLTDLAGDLNNILNEYGVNGGSGGGGTGEVKDYDITKTEDLNVIKTTNHETIKVKDVKENKITLPKGFRIKLNEGTIEKTTVQQGIVISDSVDDRVQGNEFVWIPVGVVTKDDGTPSNEIKLGRYTFAGSSSTDPAPGIPILAGGSYQYAYTEENAKNYEGTVTNIKDSRNYACHELVTREDPTKNEGVASSGTKGLNAIAKDLGAFVTSVKNNGGYYLARYEASYGGGYEPSGSDDKAKYGKAKPLSQPSTVNSTSSMPYDTPGKLWNLITQLNASKVCKNMYTEVDNVGVESDLVNSYAWDTAIVYIQEMGHTNYSNKIDGNGTLKNTGETNESTGKPNDEVCKINDMGSNLFEWTTEYSTGANSSNAYPCVFRGGNSYSSNDYTASRTYSTATNSNPIIGFRLLLYVK